MANSVDTIVASQQIESLKNISQVNNNKSKKQGSAAGGMDKVNVHLNEVYKSLTVLGDEIIKKLDEIMAAHLPNGIASLNPTEHTSETTAERIVSGVTTMMPTFAKQNPELEGEELLDKFMETIRGGISVGYKDAVGILESLNAFEFSGVQGDIEKTMSLVEEKLKTFEEQYRSDNGLVSKEPPETANQSDPPNLN